MTCNHCGSALAVLNDIDDDRFCSEEHRSAYLRASGNKSSKKMQKSSSTNAHMRGQQLGTADPPHSAGFQIADFQEAGGITPPRRHCKPEEFALEVVAPSSAIREAVPSLCSASAMPVPRMPWWASMPGTNLSHVVTLLPAQLPRMPPPIPAALLRDEAAQPDRPKWHRWAVLAACFVGIAAATDFLVFRRADQSAVSASQGPAALFEDFTAGFDRWDGAEEGPKPWTLDPGRGAMPNSLALFKPSAGMTGYRLEFSGDVLKNGISWAVRAADPLNYQALQITKKKKGGEMQLWFTRYSVIAGKEGPRTQIPLQLLLPAQSLWLVRMETIGESSTLWIENQIANSWSEAEAAPGGSIGFFAGKGDQYVLKKVRITPQ